MTVSRIPCNIVAGPLGTGKTTAILRFLRARARSENIAVIVNDFGKTGLDAEVLRLETGAAGRVPEVRNLPGGCLCCSSGRDVETTLRQVLELPDLTRIIIEPSGLAIMPDFLLEIDRIRGLLPLEPRPAIAILNPKRVKQTHYENLPFFSSLVDCADILVANRMDICSAEERAHFSEWTARLKPPKLEIIETAFGDIPPEVFDRVAPVGGEADRTGLFLPEARAHAHPEDSGGWVEAEPRPIRAAAFLGRLRAWARDGVESAECLRFKATWPTDEGWKLFEIADGAAEARAIPPGENGKIDWIARGVIHPASVRRAIAECARDHPSA